MCRLGALKISAIKPTLDAHNINLVAVGLEQLGAEEFVAREFFKGEVYVDEKKTAYQTLGYKRFGWLSIIKALLSLVSRTALSEVRSRNIDGNMSGDGLQNGGLLIVSKGGEKVLLNHKEETPGDHVSNAVILRILGISDDSGKQKSPSPTPPQCSEDACAVPTKPA